MTVPAGRQKVGADRDRLVLHTTRDGLAASAGHDLKLGISHWSGELTVGDDGVPAGLDIRIDLTSLSVLEGRGGIKALTDRDKRDIRSQARKTLGSDQRPEAVFTGRQFQPDGQGGGSITGELALAGQTGPVTLQVTSDGGRYHAQGVISQRAFGLKPYSGLFGALKVSDPVTIEADVDLSGTAAAT